LGTQVHEAKVTDLSFCKRVFETGVKHPIFNIQHPDNHQASNLKYTNRDAGRLSATLALEIGSLNFLDFGCWCLELSFRRSQTRQTARVAVKPGGRINRETLLLFLFREGGSRLRSRGLGHALLEFINAPGGIDELLLSRVEGMAGVANTHDNDGLGRACLNHIAAGATDLGIDIFRMNVCFHKRPEKIPPLRRMTRRKFWENQGHLTPNFLSQ
jgi:hypothetical protein